MSFSIPRWITREQFARILNCRPLTLLQQFIHPVEVLAICLTHYACQSFCICLTGDAGIMKIEVKEIPQFERFIRNRSPNLLVARNLQSPIKIVCVKRIPIKNAPYLIEWFVSVGSAISHFYGRFHQAICIVS
ncbi:MAG: hypothetical protein QM715_04125 [Nibricoccus sp.]